ncbi:hypothetical protein I553_6694 [Mycobacterium xenopi 4042]|uniref:Uncharacterized protein n=1 Tax=Mycobacterium xenopi 4042 TaxID=1299334 RepID=X8DBZ4_MYCXE|nr:hypothetical protein I553_6694 [Mycobacterium xenopi 4042]
MARRLKTWSAIKLAAVAARLGGTPIGRAARVSTGDPKVTMLAMVFE